MFVFACRHREGLHPSTKSVFSCWRVNKHVESSPLWLHRYFEQLVEQFEARMLSYRQQIETLESHLSALQQPVRHSPSEIFTLIKRLHETFIALAAQLQQVHEAMKVQFQTPHPLARVNRNNNTTLWWKFSIFSKPFSVNSSSFHLLQGYPLKAHLMCHPRLG